MTSGEMMEPSCRSQLSENDRTVPLYMEMLHSDDEEDHIVSTDYLHVSKSSVAL